MTIVSFKGEQNKQDLGLKCSAWKVFGSNNFGLVALYQKKQIKKTNKKEILSPKNFGSKKILGSKNI